MKKTILALLLLVSFSGIAQSKKGVTKQKSAIPVFMIDSIRVNKAYFDYMNANDIASFYEFRNEQYPDGILYITTKNPAEMLKYLQSPLVSLNDITKTNVPKADRKKPILYLLDNKLLTDTADVLIPSIRVLRVHIVKAAETAYFKTTLPNVLLMMISTRPPVIDIKGLTANN